MRILFLSRWYPYPADNGSKIRISNLLRGLCDRHDVTLISFFDPRDELKEHPEPAPRQIHVCPYREFNPSSGRSITGFVSSRPRSIVDTYSPEMASRIRQVVRQQGPDVVIASEIAMASYHDCYAGTPAVFEGAELGIYCPRGADLDGRWRGFRQQLTWHKQKRFMAELVGRHNICTVPSTQEKSLVLEAVPDCSECHVIPNAVNLQEYRVTKSKTPNSLIFAGSYRYQPNFEAMEWCVREILPQIVEEVPEVHLTITGETAGRQLPSSPNVTHTGRLDDIHSAVAASAVSIAPIRAAGGTRLKILEALALGTPVVATSKAVEGIDARDGEHLLIADEPSEFAAAVLRLLRDREYAESLGLKGKSLIKNQYDWASVLPRFLRLVEMASAGPLN